MRLPPLLAIALLAAACGEDAPPAPPKKAGAPAPGRPGAPGQKAKQLQARTHVEERVTCPEIEKATGPKCDPAAASCEAGLYCVPVKTGGNFCEPCPERDSIRHDFKDRDFVADQVRDPFQPFIIPLKGLEPQSDKKVEGPCNRPEQFVAGNYSYLDLRLVGIVAQGTQRKVLMMDRGNVGHIIRRGDCVGKEKAVVKDIGPGFVTFVIHPDADDKTPNRVPEERSVLLNPKGLQVAPEAPPEASGSQPSAPIVAPPANQ
ncbi:MAG TPA: pilus assembly protein PilP [Kofleriaceae bacterium]|nr:pilus assembly protein PilP [Kofleriaceae bacterium]